MKSRNPCIYSIAYKSIFIYFSYPFFRKYLGQRLFSRKIVKFISCSKFLLRFNTELTRFRSSASHHNKRRMICQSNKSHFVSHRKAFYEAYSRARQVIGWFLSDSEKFGRTNAISTYLRLKSREVSFLTKLSSPRDTLAHFLMLRSWSYLSIYFSTSFLICCVTLLTDLGGALKRLHLTLTYYIFYFCFLRSIVLIVHNPCRLLAISWGKWVFCFLLPCLCLGIDHMLRQNVVGKKKKNVFACVKLVVTRWRAFRLSNQCSLTRVTGSYTCWKSFFFPV